MELNRTNIEAHIEEARRMRSEALGQLLADGWHFCANQIHSLVSTISSYAARQQLGQVSLIK